MCRQTFLSSFLLFSPSLRYHYPHSYHKISIKMPQDQRPCKKARLDQKSHASQAGHNSSPSTIGPSTPIAPMGSEPASEHKTTEERLSRVEEVIQNLIVENCDLKSQVKEQHNLYKRHIIDIWGDISALRAEIKDLRDALQLFVNARRAHRSQVFNTWGELN